MNSLKKYEDKINNISLFYVPVRDNIYHKIVEFAKSIGSKLQGDKNLSYEYVLFNPRDTQEGDLNSNSYFFTERNRADTFPIISLEELSRVSKAINSLKDHLVLNSASLYSVENNSITLKPFDVFEHLSEKGVKLSSDKAPMGKLLRQFPQALEAIAFRSKFGHEKYIESDKDWMNFKRVPNALEQYHDATVRHLAEIGDEEDSLEHLTAAAWNILATLQITLENND